MQLVLGGCLGLVETLNYLGLAPVVIKVYHNSLMDS